MTLYEVDRSGWVFRQVQLYAEGSRFAPENILMCHPVNLDAMVKHPAAEEICGEEFELLWSELAPEREFHARLPDAGMPWAGTLELKDVTLELRWLPDEQAPAGWIPVPGFAALFVLGDEAAARSACAAVFIDRPIEWSSVQAAAAA